MPFDVTKMRTEVRIHFSVGGISIWDFFYGGIFHGKGSLQGVNFSGEIIHWGNSYCFKNRVKRKSQTLAQRVRR